MSACEREGYPGTVVCVCGWVGGLMLARQSGKAREGRRERRGDEGWGGCWRGRRREMKSGEERSRAEEEREVEDRLTGVAVATFVGADTSIISSSSLRAR